MYGYPLDNQIRAIESKGWKFQVFVGSYAIFNEKDSYPTKTISLWHFHHDHARIRLRSDREFIDPAKDDQVCLCDIPDKVLSLYKVLSL